MLSLTLLAANRNTKGDPTAQPSRFQLTIVPWWVIGSIHRIVHHRWQEEKRDYLNSRHCGESESHIFRDLQIVKSWLANPPERVVPISFFSIAAVVFIPLLFFFLPELLFILGLWK